MNVLYKYCDQLGIVKILGSLELKLPYVSQVNDPLECLPFFYCPNDISAMKEQFLRTSNRKNFCLPVNWEQNINDNFDEIKKRNLDALLEAQRKWNQQNCLLSVSETAKDITMWAHYADEHKGVVIGVDFHIVHQDTIRPYGALMHAVSYSNNRPEINILEGFEENVAGKAFQKTVLTKSDSWRYEKEYRTIIPIDSLAEMQKQGLTRLGNFKGKSTWFLRLNPGSIKQVIFGLYTDDSLKSAIKKLIKRQDLHHVKLYEVEESETYNFNLIEVT